MRIAFPVALNYLVVIVVGSCCFQPISSNVISRTLPYFELTKRPPVSASATELMSCFKIVAITRRTHYKDLVKWHHFICLGKMSSHAGYHFLHRYILCVTVDVKYHLSVPVTNFSVGMSRTVFQNIP